MRTGRISHILLLTFISLLVSIDMNATTPVKPDFAFPKTVSANSEKSLAEAMKTDDGPAITRALINYYLAQTRIDAANARGALARIDSVCASSADPVLKAILLTLQADIYSAVYSSNRWKYDSRNLPATPLPADFNEWSGEQFRTRITALFKSALAYETDLKKAPIASYASVIEMGQGSRKYATATRRLTEIYYPTLYDFVASQSVNGLMSTGRVESLLSWGLLTRHNLYTTLPFSKYDPVVAEILGIYASLLRFHQAGTAPFILADINRINFVSSHVYTSDSDDARKLENRKAELLKSLYEENRSSEYSGDILLAMTGNSSERKWLYSSLAHNIKAFPAYPRKDELTNQKLRLEEKSVSLSYPEVAAPGVTAKFALDIDNVSSGKIYIYNVSSSPLTDRGYNCTGLPAMKPVAVLPFSAPAGSAVPFSDKVNVEYAFPEVGAYIAVATIDGVKPSARRWYEKINVTRYSLAASKFDKTMLWAINAMDGAPVEGAKITLYKDRGNQSVPTAIGSTAADGALDVTGNGNAFMTKGTDRYAVPVWIYNPERNSSKDSWHSAVSGYSALALYHPGDSVEWMAIVYEYKGREHRPVIHKEVSAVLHDANYREIDTLKLTTDAFGRVNGKFLIPKESLSGRFSVTISKEKESSAYPALGFMVSDYKLPTYRVILDPVEKDYPATGDVTLRGRLETYSGFPVGDAGLTLELSATPKARWWWNRSASVKFYTLDSKSDAEGRIEITIPKDVLEISPIPGGIYSATLTALSPAGESQTASTVFSTGERYIIRASVPQNIDITAPTALIKTSVVNYQDSVMKMPVDFAVIRDSAEILRGTIAPGQPTLDLSSLASGEYQFRFSLADTTLAETVTQTAVLYRPTDKNTPVPGKLLWYPESKLTVGADGQGKWLYAVDCATNLLVTLHSDSKILSREWVSAPEGMNTLSVSLPSGVDNAVMEIAVTGNYRTSEARIEINRDVTAKGIRFITESFRDRLVPGSEETWTFRVVDESGEGRKSAVVLDMYNTALDALATQQWSFSPMTQGSAYYYSWNQSGLNSQNNQYISYLPGKYVGTVSPVTPEFSTYGLPLSPDMNYRFGSIRIRGTRAMMKSSADNLNSVSEHKEEIMAVDELKMEAADADAGGAVMNLAADYAAPKAMATGAMQEEAAEAENDGENNDTAREIPFTYRDREVALAFFKPMLTTDAEGHLTFTFTVPNANTTWGFKALAYTDSLMSTTFSADVIANKPVMVQPNLPRFVRAGDRVAVLASVMNGSDSEQNVETRIELFSAADGKTITEYTQNNFIAAGSSAVVEMMINVPTDSPFIGYRIKSSTGRFADGEQTLIPVLQAVSPVIDTYPFYIAPEEKSFSMDMPRVPADARVTLQFCENPVWYVVTALPGILDREATTANEAAASIFSAAIASGLLRDNPAIAEALREWSESDKSDGTLTSMLEKNEDLKQVLLASTPWMLDAKNDSERMSRLATLFDKNTVNSTIKANIAILGKLSCSGGGWAWCSYYRVPSQWATENVLLLFGHLRALGYMPDSRELDRMIASALHWLDSVATKTFNKYPKTDFTLYVYLRDRFKGMNGVRDANRAIVNATVQRILADWKSASVFSKGVYAQILAKNSYPSVANTILASLREYSEYTPTKGMWWPSLDNMTLWSMGKVGTTAMLLETFAMVEPGCQDIDRIRQWLILQKEAQNWGNSVTTSSAVAAILSTSAKWVEPAKGSRISVCGKSVEPAKAERQTGYFRTQLPLTSKSKGQLKVMREGDTPSWGALFYLYTDSMTSIKAHDCPELSIEKQINVNGTYTDALSVGDRVSVTLTLRVDRDMDYVTIVDERPACYEPVEQMPTPLFSEGLYFYRENRDSSTRLFIDHLPKGTYILTYDVWVNNAGEFASGVATAQSQYAPQFTAHTSGQRLTVAPAGK